MPAPRIVRTFALFIVCSSTRLGAQEAAVPKEAVPAARVSASVGVGIGAYGPAGQLGLSVSTSAGEFVLRTAGTEEFVILAPAQSVGDVAVLYGRRASGSKGWVRAAAGPGFVFAERRGLSTSCALFFCDYEMETSSALGLALQLDAVWAITRSFGLGLDAFADLSSDDSFTGLTINVLFGRLR